MSLRAPRRLVAAAAVPALLAGVAIAAPANAAPSADEPKYKGSAFALQARVALGGETLLDLMLPDAVVFPTGGDKNLLGLPAELKDVATLKVLNASAGVKDRKFAANSSTAGLSLLGNLVGARVLNSDCSADQLRLAGDSSVAGIELLGTKVPVDPGPNFRIDIPKELEALLKGSVVIDEQNKLDNGGLQVRALHINLVVAPDALGAALKSALASVRAVAEQLVTTVEAATGQSLDSLLAKTETVAPRAGGAQADKSVRTKSDAAKVTKTQKVEKAKVATKAASTEKASVAAEQTQTEAATEEAAPARETTVSKADEAAVNRQAAADQAAAERAMAERAERGAKPAAARTGTTEQQAADAAAAAERAESSTAQGETVEAPAQTETTPADTTVEQKTTPAEKAEKVRAGRIVTQKSDRAELGTPDRTAVRAAAPAAEPKADDDIDGLIGLDVIVSEVNCVGAKFIKDEPKRVLPKTGGNGDMSRDMAVAGLGLLMAGSAAAFVTRRRRHLS